VKTLDLEHNDAFANPKQAGLLASRNNYVPPVTTATATHDDLSDAKRLEPWVEALSKGLKVDPIKETRTEVKETRLINISFDHSVPQIASGVVNAVADTAAIMNLERKAETTTTAAEFLQKRVAELQSQIRRREALINVAPYTTAGRACLPLISPRLHPQPRWCRRRRM